MKITIITFTKKIVIFIKVKTVIMISTTLDKKRKAINQKYRVNAT